MKKVISTLILLLVAIATFADATATTNIPSAPKPSVSKDLVYSLYSDTYGDNIGDPWAGTEVTINGNNAIHLSDTYTGASLTTKADVSDYDYMIFTVYLAGSSSQKVRFYPITDTSDTDETDLSSANMQAELKPNAWNIVVIDLHNSSTGDKWGSTAMNAQYFKKLKSFMITSEASVDIYIDNIYFQKKKYADDNIPKPPTPTVSSSLVFPIYSDTYGTAAGFSNTGFYENDHNNVSFPEVDIHGKKAMKIANHTTFGFNFGSTPYDISSKAGYMVYTVFPLTDLYLDFYTYTGDSWGNISQRAMLTANTWNSVVVDLSKISADDLKKLDMLMVSGGDYNIDLYLDDIYVYYDPTTSPMKVDTGDNKNYVSAAYDRSPGRDDSFKASCAADNDLTTIWNAPETEGDPNTTPEKTYEDGKYGSWLCVELREAITIKDIEIIWSSGYAKNYKIRCFDEKPYQEDNGVYELYDFAELTGYDDDIAASREDFVATTVPYYDVHSNVNAGNAKYVVIYLEDPGNEHFDYSIYDVRVYGEPSTANAYYDIATVGTTNLTARTNETIKDVEVIGMNARGSHLTGSEYDEPIANQTMSEATLTCNDPRVTVTLNDNGKYDVTATAPGFYTLNASAIVDGKEVTGSGVLQVLREWKETSAIASENNIAKGNSATASNIENSDYSASKAVDGTETEDNKSRFSSFNSVSDTDDKAKKNDYQWLAVDLGDDYAITDVEISWESAYATKYTLYGFTSEQMSSLPEEGSTIDFTTGTPIYSQAMLLADNKMYPYHDYHTSLSSSDTKQARYVILKLDTRATAYGFSLWEMRVAGVSMDKVNATRKIGDVYRKIKEGATATFNVEAMQDNGTVTNSNVTGATFTTNNSGKFEVNDLQNGTYRITTKKGSHSTTEYTETISSVDALGNPLTATLTVYIYQQKERMKKIESQSTETHFVYDDGYFWGDVIKDDVNGNHKVTAIDLRNVDFDVPKTFVEGTTTGTENAETERVTSVSKPSDYGMSPNAITYTDESDVTAPYNLAHLNTTGTTEWDIDQLYLFDGYDFDPLASYTTKAYVNGFFTNLKAGWHSFLTLPFDISATELQSLQTNKQVKMYLLTGYDDNDKTAVFTQTTETIKAGTSAAIYTDNGALESDLMYLLKIHPTSTTDLETLVAAKSYGYKEGSDILLTGTYKQLSSPASDNYINYNYASGRKRFELIDGVADNQYQTVQPFYAYLQIPVTSQAAKFEPAKISLRFIDMDGTVTEIKDVKAYVSGDGRYYDLGGREVNAAAQEGVYIYNGRKIIK